MIVVQLYFFRVIYSLEFRVVEFSFYKLYIFKVYIQILYLDSYYKFKIS